LGNISALESGVVVKPVKVKKPAFPALLMTFGPLEQASA
jgi:hypothetical protein